MNIDSHLINHNPRSRQYKQAYAWMNSTQCRTAYRNYLQEKLTFIQNLISEDCENGKQFNQRLYDQTKCLEERIFKLDQAEYRRYMDDNERLCRIIDRNSKEY